MKGNKMILYNVRTEKHQEYTLKKYCDEFNNNSLSDGFNVKMMKIFMVMIGCYLKQKMNLLNLCVRAMTTLN